jgi:hypothetical protein
MDNFTLPHESLCPTSHAGYRVRRVENLLSFISLHTVPKSVSRVVVSNDTHILIYVDFSYGETFWEDVRRGADKTLASLFSYLQNNQKNISWIG